MMQTIWKLEPVYADFEDMRVYDTSYVLADNYHKLVNEFIPKYVELDESNKSFIKLHHFVATELPLGTELDDTMFLKRRVLLPDGSLYVSMDYRNIFLDMNFQGRKLDECKLKVGDRCYCFFSDKIKTGVVAELPPLESFRHEGMDVFDDSYTVLIGLDKIPEKLLDETYMRLHEHVCVDSIFKRG